MVSLLIKDESDIGFVKATFLSKVGFLNGLPYFLAFAGTTNQRPRLEDQLLHFVTRDVSQTAEGLVHDTAWNLMRGCSVRATSRHCSRLCLLLRL